MLKVTFLGTGGAVPSVRRGLPAIAVKYDKLFLWDCGEGTQREMMKRRVGYGGVDAVFISHLHLDHFIGVFGLIETIRMTTGREGLPVYAPARFGDILAALSPSHMWKPGFVDVREMGPGTLYRGKDYEIQGFRVKHGGRDSFGLAFIEDGKVKFNEKKAKAAGLKGRMFTDIQKKGWLEVGGKKVELPSISKVRKGRKVVYSGDTVPCEAVAEMAKGADLLIHDGTFGERVEDEALARGHTSVTDAAKIAKRAGVETLVLTHISTRHSDEEKELLAEARKAFKNSYIAKDGMSVEIKPDGKQAVSF